MLVTAAASFNEDIGAWDTSGHDDVRCSKAPRPSTRTSAADHNVGHEPPAALRTRTSALGGRQRHGYVRDVLLRLGL